VNENDLKQALRRRRPCARPGNDDRASGVDRAGGRSRGAAVPVRGPRGRYCRWPATLWNTAARASRPRIGKGGTCLHYAAESGKRGVLRYLIERGG
jgi:hypothetical protein